MNSLFFGLSVLHNDRILTEYGDGSVALPFNSDYKLRLSNNATRRCSAKITIDDEVITTLILGAYSSVNIDCYPATLKKLKFVSEKSAAAKRAGKSKNINKRNGVVSVEFNSEVDRSFRPYINILPHPPWNDMPYYDYDDSNILRSNSLYGAAAAGCTVEGEASDQRFNNVYFDAEPGTGVILKLILKGDHRRRTHCDCGQRINKNANYCSCCGKQIGERSCLVKR